MSTTGLVCATTAGVLTLGVVVFYVLPYLVDRSVHVDGERPSTVEDVVSLGRIPHRGVFGGDAEADAEAVRKALAHTAMTDKAQNRWHTLSGGERQRTQIARALAQQPRELLLDEPTNHLDIRHQLDLLALVTALPVTCYIALHDLNLAAMFCDRLLILGQGRIVAFGTPAEVITTEMVERVYQVRAQIGTDPITDIRSCRIVPTCPIPVRDHHTQRLSIPNPALVDVGPPSGSVSSRPCGVIR